MKKLLGLFVAVLVSVGLTGGLVAANSGSLDTTGPDSDNTIEFANESEVDVDNYTRVNAEVRTDQDADSGDALVKHNTTGGDAESGDASNESEVSADLSIDNSSANSAALACACANGSGDDASIENTGPKSSNHITFNNSSSVTVKNDTQVNFKNNVDQDADSGNATVWGNTTGGNATSGSASNSSSTTFSLSVTN